MMTKTSLNSAIYQGSINHRRFSPSVNSFTYQMYMLALDLDEVEQCLPKMGVFGYSWFKPIRFCQQDYLKDEIKSEPFSLKQRIYKKIAKLGADDSITRVTMLVQVRCFGFYFSPANFYFCYDKNEKCKYVLVEVSNTPWNQRHYYLLNMALISEQGTEKSFHVSPFMHLAMQYHWKITPPSQSNDKLVIHIENKLNDNDITKLAGKPTTKFFDVSLGLKRKALTKKNIFSTLVRFPFMTGKMVSLIYWQALKLFIKRIPFISYQKL